VPYTLTQAADPMAIAECQWALASAVKFTTFTSCIGVIGQIGQQNILGIHLVAVDSGGNAFDLGDVPQVQAVCTNAGVGSTWIIGGVAYWENSLAAAYNALVTALNPTIYSWGDGQYGAEIDANGQVEFTY
jgi:hypothetical protein